MTRSEAAGVGASDDPFLVRPLQHESFVARTGWARRLQTPLRVFVRTETGSAAVLLAATIAALAWANGDHAGYANVWHTRLSVALGPATVSHDLQYWVSDGLMAVFFFAVGLEARREFDIGELRDRQRVLLPVAAAIGAMLLPVTLYLALNAGHASGRGWGVAMSTDTAFALGMLALVGPRFPIRLRAFMLTVAVVDDLAALAVIAIAYSAAVHTRALLVAIVLFAAFVLVARLAVERRIVWTSLGLAGWLALSKSGVDPIVLGLAMGLLIPAAPVARGDLERASHLFRRFREQPTPELARTARIGLSSALSPNERLQLLVHPWSSYVIVPLFALANAGVRVDAAVLARTFSSPIALGIVIGYVAGKPAGFVLGSRLITWLTRGAVSPPVGWAAVAGGGSVAGIGFTVSLLIAGLAFRGAQLDEAKLGVIAAALCASVLAWLLFRATALLPTPLRSRALLGTGETIVDLAVSVDPQRDHIRGPLAAPVTLVEYGDFECPYCGRAEPVVRELLRDVGDVRYVWRHLPLGDVHPHADLAAEAAELAGEQGAFWEMHDLLFANQDALTPSDLVRYAGELGLDVERFTRGLERHAAATRVAEDVDGADLSNVSGTPTFFVNGRRHHGAYDLQTLSHAVRVARARAGIASRVLWQPGTGSGKSRLAGWRMSG